MVVKLCLYLVLDGWTAFFFTAREDKIEVVETLLEYGATAHIRNEVCIQLFCYVSHTHSLTTILLMSVMCY